MLFDPAGHDRALATTMQEITAQHWTSVRDLLAATGAKQRTHRVELLSIAAAGTQVIECWLEEEPDSYDAHLMWASVLVERALRAAKVQDAQAPVWEMRARQACLVAVERDPSDPVPLVRLLALAQLDVTRRLGEHRRKHGEVLIPDGPWKVLARIHDLDPYNREAFHRGQQFVQAIGVPPSDFSSWAASISPEYSPLRVLPLYAWVRVPSRQESHHAWRSEWGSEPARHDIDSAFAWFLRQKDPRQSCTVNDLSHLAAACWAAMRFEDAQLVFAAMEPYASLSPWKAFAGGDTRRAHELLTMTHGQCRSISAKRSEDRPADPQPDPQPRGRHAQPTTRPSRGLGRLFGGSS
ncbi:hypothetical protein [Streptomyces sp. NPDC004376]